MNRDPSRAKQRGFTLLETMIALAVGGIISTTVFATLILQQRIYIQQLAYAEAQQNARAALAIVTSYVRRAGWGVVRGATTGPVPIGSCLGSTINCNNVDTGSDRIRPVFNSEDSFAGYLTWEPGYSMFRIGPKTGPDPGGIPIGTVALVSGPCKCPGPDCGQYVSDLITITGDVNDGQWWHKYQYSGSLSCNYGAGFSFGANGSVDIYVDKSNANHPKLVLDPDADGTASPLDIAYDIEDFQVQYGLDTTATADGIVDMWCDNLALANCATGLSTDRDNQTRVIAVRLAVVARTREPQQNYVSQALTVFDHSISGGDGYRRWIYRMTLALRSINL